MSLKTNWTPMRWRCGPIEAVRLSTSSKETGNAKSGAAKTAGLWADSAMLELLDGTCVNCLLVDWAVGGDIDAAQQIALQPLIGAGRKQGISFVGIVTTRDGLPSIAAAAKAAGLEALLLSGSIVGELPLPVIAAYPRNSVDWDHVTDTFVLNGNVWPQAVVRTYGHAEGSDTASAGPSRAPWIESNGWVSRLAHAIAPGKLLWLEVPLPDTKERLPAEKYCLAVADARAYGSRWIIDLDDAMRTALAERESEAIESWKKIARIDAFFDSHSQSVATQPIGMLTVISDFYRENLVKSGEVMNVLGREQIPFAVADRRRTLDSALAEKRAILWVDAAAPSGEQYKLLLAFVEQGGLVIAPNYWGPAGVAPHRVLSMIYHDFYSIGKGRIVTASAGFSDPFVVARDSHSIVGREHDPLRLFDSGTASCFATADPAHELELVQIMNYAAPKPAVYTSLWVRGSTRMAQLSTAESSSPIRGEAAGNGTTFDLPPFAVYCAIEVRRNI